MTRQNKDTVIIYSDSNSMHVSCSLWVGFHIWDPLGFHPWLITPSVSTERNVKVMKHRPQKYDQVPYFFRVGLVKVGITRLHTLSLKYCSCSSNKKYLFVPVELKFIAVIMKLLYREPCLANIMAIFMTFSSATLLT